MNTNTSADEFLAAIVTSSSDAILTKNLAGVITSWNQGAERIFGYTADEIIGQPVTVLFPPDRFNEEPGILARVQRGEIIDHYETVRLRKNGSRVEISLTVSPVRNVNGEIVGASKIVRDISEVKRAQERFRATLSAIRDGVITTDESGNINFANFSAGKLSGSSPEDLLGKSFARTFHFLNERTRQPLEIEQKNTPVVKGAEILLQTAILVKNAGGELPIEYSLEPILDMAAQGFGGVFVFRDISEMRQKERAAVRLVAIVEGSDDAIIGKDLTGVVTDWNKGAERLFGYSPPEIIGKSITMLLPEERLNEEQQILARLQRGERVDHFETERKRKDGSILNVSLSISPVRDREGIVIGASKIVRDITPLIAARKELQNHSRELEVKVRQRTARLQETISELESFSYSLTHDMRAPVRSIQSFTEIVLSDFGGSLSEEGKGYLTKVIKSATRLDRLIQDVLAFAQISQAEIQITEVNVERLLQEIIQERPDFQKPKADIRVLQPMQPMAAHEASLTQCLTNLLQNATKFVSPGTTPLIEIFSEHLENKVRLCVRDNGIGIDRAGRERLFAIFQRLPTVHLYQGTGVGLAIVRKAAERMNGNVGVDSTPGKGSTFWIELQRFR